MKSPLKSFQKCQTTVECEYRINGGGGVRIIAGGLEMVQYSNNQGVGTVGGSGCLEKLKIVVFLVKHVSFLYLCEQ